VPRPETEELVELLVSDFRLQGSEPRILDVGTGSGVIALSLAGRVPEAKIVATDISDDALDLAMENATRLDLTARVQFVKSNLFEGLVERFDLIVANLPYIAMADRTSLSREVLRDPEVALFGGDHGDELIRRLVAGAPEKLVPGGLLALEIGLGQADAILLALAEKKYEDIAAKNDYSGRPRFVFARYG
jgi:release factor glutamine methyltransferase